MDVNSSIYETFTAVRRAQVDAYCLSEFGRPFGELTQPEAAQALAVAAQARPTANGNGHGPKAAAWVSQLRNLADAYQERPPLTYVVEKLTPAGSLSIWYGIAGALKSMLAGDMGICAATGVPWLRLPDGGGGLATTRTPVVFVDFDNGRRRSDARFEAIGRAYKAPPDAPFHYLSMADPHLDLSQPASAALLTDLVRHVGAGLVFLDNLRLVSGNVEENSAGMAVVMGALRRLCEDTGAAVVVIHHQRKSGGPEDRQHLDTLRGHSSISASLDLALHVDRDPANGRHSVTLVPVKMRDGDVPILAADFAYTHRESGELSEARFFGRVLEDTTSKQAIRMAALAVLAGGEQLKQKDLVAAIQEEGVTAGVNFIRSIITELCNSGELVEAKGERGAKVYSLI